MQQAETTGITVIGAGPAGLVAALALSRSCAKVTIAAPFGEPRSDRRTTAVLGGGMNLLKNLGVWEACAPHSAPLRAIRIIDDRGNLLRAPEVLFRSSDMGMQQFGANIPNAVLVTALRARIQTVAEIACHETQSVAAIAPLVSGVSFTDAEGRSWTASLAVGADGRESLARKAANIAARTWSYPQTAIVTTLAHTRTHDGTSTEFHRAAGPLTTVPLPDPIGGGYASSLVWVETPAEAKRLAALDEPAFTSELSTRLHGLLGRIEHIGPRAAIPLSGLHADVMARDRIALVGEAAHVLPPIGAQGLNLGLRDAAALADCVADGSTKGLPPGDPSVLSAYQSMRATDVWSRTIAIDALNRSLLLDMFPVQTARSLGLHLTANSPALQKLAMHHGLEPLGGRPRLMQSIPAGDA
jgi:2-octaprenyl-6-methoxyphenol hydroxylase